MIPDKGLGVTSTIHGPQKARVVGEPCLVGTVASYLKVLAGGHCESVARWPSDGWVIRDAVPSRKGKKRLNPSVRAEDDNSSGLVLRWAVRVTPLALRRTTAYESRHASRRTSTGGGSVRTPGNHAQPVGEGRQEIVLNCSPYLPWTYRHWSVGGRSQAHRRQALRRWCFPPSLVRGDFLLLGWVGWFGSLRSGSDTLKGG